MNSNHIPDIQIKEKSIEINWPDGHKSSYNPKYLRIHCGCAECVEEWSNRKLLDPVTVSENIQAVDYLIVGRYAVQFLWSDEHYTGISPFETIRKLCKCNECSTK